jgi:hypothetical protein
MSISRLTLLLSLLILTSIGFLIYGIWSVPHSKKVSDNTNSKIFLRTGIAGIIYGGTIIGIFLIIAIIMGLIYLLV